MLLKIFIRTSAFGYLFFLLQHCGSRHCDEHAIAKRSKEKPALFY